MTSGTVPSKRCECGSLFPDIFGTGICPTCVFKVENPVSPSPPRESNAARTMLMMDGPLLTINFLMVFMRDLAINELGVSADDDDAEGATAEILALMVKWGVFGLRRIQQDRNILSWNEIEKFAKAVVEEHNR